MSDDYIFGRLDGELRQIEERKKALKKRLSTWGVVSFYFKIGRDKADPEKTVLPTILYINTNHEAFADVKHRGFVLCFGWWDFSVKFGVCF